MAPERRDPRRGDEWSSELAAALGPHVDGLVAAAAERELANERELALASMRRLDEEELMTLIFAHLDDDNPRVCVGIDFDRLVILADVAMEATPEPASRPAADPRPAIDPSPAASPPRLEARLVDHVWAGRGWIDEVQAIDPALLDRPELDAQARGLLERARGRVLPTVNLRRLEREPALAHLDFFVKACRQRRARWIRAITGKGIESRGEPVIKRAVLSWCRQHGLDSAPELDVHGEWGALVIHLGGDHA
jgi:DNA-nicking Smr family endonuclease